MWLRQVELEEWRSEFVDGCNADSADRWYWCHVPLTEVIAGVDEIGEAADCWQSAHRVWLEVVEHRDRVVARAEARIVRARGGLTLAEWEAACRRRRINTAVEAAMASRAVRARPAVLAKIEEARRLLVAEDMAVLAARLELARATKQLLGYGSAACQLTGKSSRELRQLARRPREPSSVFTS